MTVKHLAQDDELQTKKVYDNMNFSRTSEMNARLYGISNLYTKWQVTQISQ